MYTGDEVFFPDDATLARRVSPKTFDAILKAREEGNIFNGLFSLIGRLFKKQSTNTAK